MKSKKINKMVYASMYCAMIFVLTRFIQIPVASGYVHFGDALIYIVALTVGGPWSMFAAALGAALADLTSGFAIYIPATVIIKMLIALPFVLVNSKSEKILSPTTALLTIPAGVITVVGYFLADLMIDKAYAFVDIMGNVIQATGSAFIFIALAAALDAAQIKKKLFGGK